jgi:hypothetical protein
MDSRLFQIDRDFARFQENTVAARGERLEKYVCLDPDFDAVASEVCRYILNRLLVEYPAYFEWEPARDGAGVFRCRLTKERLSFDRESGLVNVESLEPPIPLYRNAFDALMSQVPEDIAVVTLPEGKPDKNAALHVTAPSHWAPEEKIGTSFLQTHAPVPHFERIAAASASLLESVRARSKGVVRFNWGIEFTDRLNLHPEPPPGSDGEEWNRRRIQPLDECPVYLRVERQVLVPLNEARALLFAIRIYVQPVTQLSPGERDAVRATLLSMPETSRLYKGLSPGAFADAVRWMSDRND